MKQKMVVKVTMNGQKSRSKALKIVVGFSGVISASFKGDDQSQIEVTADGVDAVQLTSKLRKRVGYAELVSVSDASKKEEKKEEVKPLEYVCAPLYPPYYMYQEVPSYGPSCSIL